MPLFALTNPKEGEVFWDLGCGGGRAMVIAALCFPQLKAVKGVELLDGLHEMCASIITKLLSDSPI